MAFNGINNLRDSNESIEMEPWQLQEIAKCAKDPIYFIENYVYINTKDSGMQLFKMYQFQKDTILRYTKHRFNIQKWSRQSGKSTTARGYILWYSMFNADKVVAILANKLNLAQEQLQQLRDSYISLPMWMQPGVKQWNKRGVQFSHGTRIVCAATSPDGIRGMSINCVANDSIVTVRDKETGEIKQITIEQLELELHNTDDSNVKYINNIDNTLTISADLEIELGFDSELDVNCIEDING